jgi:5-oxoprolinase (ATP-hydrolysing)
LQAAANQNTGDVLEWVTWGGGGLGDPLTRPPHIVATEVHRKLVTVAGAANNYGVVVRPSDFTVNEGATTELRQKMRDDRKGTGYTEELSYDRGGKMTELMARAEEETGLPAPRPQWIKDPYGPHVGLPYVKEWYKKMREKGLEGWDFQTS